MDTKLIILLILLLALIVLVFVLFLMARKTQRDNDLYDWKWNLYNQEKKSKNKE